MSHWGYVIESLVNEDRGAAERRKHARRRRKREREQAVLAEAEAVISESARAHGSPYPAGEQVAADRTRQARLA